MRIHSTRERRPTCGQCSAKELLSCGRLMQMQRRIVEGGEKKKKLAACGTACVSSTTVFTEPRKKRTKVGRVGHVVAAARPCPVIDGWS